MNIIALCPLRNAATELIGLIYILVLMIVTLMFMWSAKPPPAQIKPTKFLQIPAELQYPNKEFILWFDREGDYWEIGDNFVPAISKSATGRPSGIQP